MSIFDLAWKEAEKKIDPLWEGSIWQTLGLTQFLCPTCGAHLQTIDRGELICLNACHLVPDGQATFHKLWLEVTKGVDIEDIIRKGKGDKENGSRDA